MATVSGDLLTALLRDVSRSFYLTLRVLPGKIRAPIGLAYLLARATDTIADTGLVPLDQRLSALAALRERILGLSSKPVEFGDLARQQGSPAERTLLERAEEALKLLGTLSEADLGRVREVLTTITSGQELDLRRFAGASAEHVVALGTDADLEDYTYRVAGCVGEFWTRMCRAHLFPRAAVDDAFLLNNGVRFGKGLQLVNILRDIPADLRLGRCYLPAHRLAALGLKPQDLLTPAAEPRLRPLYQEYLNLADNHLQAGWSYTTTLPWRCARVRLACAWPILIGMETLQLLRQANVLDPEHRVKVSRRRVKSLMLGSVVWYPLPTVWRGLGAKRRG